MNISIPTLASTNSSLPPFIWEAAGRDAGRLMPIILIVVVLAALSLISLAIKEKTPDELGPETPQPVKKSKKRGV